MAVPVKLILSLMVAALFSRGAVSAGCGQTTAAQGAQKYSDVLKSYGIHFFLSTVELTQFAEISKAARLGKRVVPGTRAASVFNTPEGLIVRDLPGRYDMSLKPLYPWHTGKWAHNLISNSDNSYLGVRSKGTFDWSVGFLFPVEVLDETPFFLTNTHSLRNRALILSGLSSAIADFSSDAGSVEDFIGVFARLIADERSGADETDALVGLRFHLPAGVSLETTQGLWIPEPIRVWIQNNQKEFLTLSTETPYDYFWGRNPDRQLEFRCSRKVGNDWVNVPPGPPAANEAFDPERRVGNWYSVVPDWEEIRKGRR